MSVLLHLLSGRTGTMELLWRRFNDYLWSLKGVVGQLVHEILQESDPSSLISLCIPVVRLLKLLISSVSRHLKIRRKNFHYI
jgi:hypothetical protein